VLIKSMAGDFEISIAGFETEGRHLVMIGKMGVWDARTYFAPSDLFALLAKLLRPAVLLYLVRLPYLMLQEKSRESKSSRGAADE